jgi:16S rRNA C1402 N4-methylase RsmH
VIGFDRDPNAIAIGRSFVPTATDPDRRAVQPDGPRPTERGLLPVDGITLDGASSMQLTSRSGLRSRRTAPLDM